MEYKFLKYIENKAAPEQSYGLMGLAVVKDDYRIHHYLVKQGKDGQGYFVSPMAQKMNNEWFKSSIVDSSYEDQQLNAMIREKVAEYYRTRDTVSIKKSDDSVCPF